MDNSNQEYYDYLVELRDSGRTNMWGASEYLRKRFKLSVDDADKILLAWIGSFKNED